MNSAKPSNEGNQPDQVASQDEQEEREQQRRPRAHPLRADIGLHDGVANELDDRLEGVHEPPRHRLIAFPADVAPHDPRHRDEEQRGDEPHHEHVLGHGEVDAEHLRQVDQRVVEAGVRHVRNDGLAGVESFACGLGRGVLGFVRLKHRGHRQSRGTSSCGATRVGLRPATGTRHRPAVASETSPRRHAAQHNNP